MRRIHWMLSLIAIAAIAMPRNASADEVRLLSVGGVKDGLDLIIAEFTKATGHKVLFTPGNPVALPKQLAAGEVFDVVVQSDQAMDLIDKAGGLRPGSRKTVVRGGIALALHPQTPMPEVATVDGFKQTLLKAKSIAMGDAASPYGSGIRVMDILKRAGLLPQIESRLQVVGLDPGQKRIAAGELDLGLINASEVRAYLKFGGYVPASLQAYTVYDVAISAKAPAAAAAAALVGALASREAARHWVAARMEPLAN